jgi:dihydroorotate dehydrogenase
MILHYFVVNGSSPNNASSPASAAKHRYWLTQLQTLQNKNVASQKQKPILLKIAPDLTTDEQLLIIDIVKETQIVGVGLSHKHNHF